MGKWRGFAMENGGFIGFTYEKWWFYWFFPWKIVVEPCLTYEKWCLKPMKPCKMVV
jgi:hypothetical protein